MEADGENVIYVQVDEHGRVVNYTTNMPGGEQVILLQEGGEDETQQQVMYQPQQVAGQQQVIQASAPGTSQIIQAPAQGTAQVIQASAQGTSQVIQAVPGTTQIIQAPSSSIQATDIIQDPNVQAQIMAQASSDAMVIQASTPSINTGSTIIETAFSQATNEAAQAAIIDGSGNRILITDDSQLPVQLMTSTASSAAPIILSNEQAQILIAGTQQQPQRRTKPVQQRTTPTIVAGAKSNRPLGRSLISQATRNLVASQRSTVQVTSQRSLPAALQPSPQQLLVSLPSQVATTSTVASAIVKDKSAPIASFQAVENIVMDELVPEATSQGEEQVVRLEEAQELSDHINAEDQISQAEKDLLQAAKEEQEKQETEATMSQDDMLQIDENPSAADQNAEQDVAMPETAKELNQDQTNIPMPDDDILIPMPEQPATETETKTESSEAPQTDSSVSEFTAISMPDTEIPTTDQSQVSLTDQAQVLITEQAPVSVTAPVSEIPLTSDTTVDSTPAEISVTLTDAEGTAKPESSDDHAQDQPMDSAAAQLNGNIFANDEEEMETDEAIQAVVVTTVPVPQSVPVQEKDSSAENKAEEKETPKPAKNVGESYAKSLALIDTFDNKYAEMTGIKKDTTPPAATESDTLFVNVKDKPVKKIIVTPSKIVPKMSKHDVDDGKDITESDDDFEFKPQGVGRPKKTYEGIASRKRQTSEKDNQDSTLNQSIAERRARRKIKPSTRNIDMSDMKDSTEDDTEDEGLIIESDKPVEKRGRGRPRKHPQDAKPGMSSPVMTSPKTAIISPGKAVQVTAAHMSPSRTIQGSPTKTVSETASSKPVTIVSLGVATITSPVSGVKDGQKEGRTPSGEIQKRGRGRPRNSETKAPGSATAGSSKEQQPDVTSSSDQFSDADPVQKSFMANFSLMTAAQRQAREEESKKRRSKRVSLQAEQKAKEEEEAKEIEQETEKKTDNIFDIFDSPKVDPINEIQSLRDDVDDLKDVNSQLLSKLSSNEDTDVKSLQAKVRKLQTVNMELKTRLRTYETKSASTKFTDRNEIKSLQAKVEKLNNQNTDLKSKVTDLELARVATPQTVDKKGVVHKMKTPKAGKHMDRSSKMSSHDLEEWAAELQAKQEAVEKKDMKQKLLDRELDERTAMLKAKEGKLGRVTQQQKTKERELEYREKQIERGLNQKQTDKRKSEHQLDSREHQLDSREHQLDLREQQFEEQEQEVLDHQQVLLELEKEFETREDVITKTEQHLQALGKELGEKFRTLENSGEDVSQAKATLENKMAESAANVKAATTPRKRNVTETVRRSTSRKRAASPATSTRGSTRVSAPSEVKQRRDSARSQSPEPKEEEKVETKSRRSVGKPRKYSPSPEPSRAKGTPRTPLSSTALNKSLVNGHAASKTITKDGVKTPKNKTEVETSETPNTTDDKKKPPQNRPIQKNSKNEDDKVTVPKRGSQRSKAGTSKAKTDLTKIKPKEKTVNGDVEEETKSLEVNDVALTLKESFAKAVKKSDSSSDKDGGAGKGKDEKNSTEEAKTTRASVGKRTRRESSPAAQPAKKRKA